MLIKGRFVPAGLLATMVVLGWLGYRVLSIDRREQIASAALLRPNGDLDEKAVAAALNARFPIGTQSNELEQLTGRLGGRCANVPSVPYGQCLGPEKDRSPACAVNDSLSCSVIVTGTLCVSTSLRLEARVTGGLTTAPIRALKWTAMC
jgi:hypothetical protein